MEREGRCCFCGRSYKNWGNDIRPLAILDADDRCCDECNLRIVIPNRMKFWFTNVEYAYVIYLPESKAYLKDETEEFELIWTDKKYEAMMFKNEIEVVDYVIAHYKKDIWEYKRLIIKEDT